MGRVRANNEDNFWCCGELLPAENHGTQGIRSETISGNRTPALAVFDGMGGESCGEMAAFVASREFGKYYSANKRTLRDVPEDFIQGVCKSMNKAVCGYSEENHIQSMGTTLAMTLFTPESMFVCNLETAGSIFLTGSIQTGIYGSCPGKKSSGKSSADTVSGSAGRTADSGTVHPGN